MKKFCCFFLMIFLLESVAGECCTPSSPSPADGAEHISPSDVLLNWECTGGTAAETYDIYLGLSSPPPLAYASIIDNEWAIMGLMSDTTYYWQIRSHCGGETQFGPIWSFSTGGLGIRVKKKANTLSLAFNPNPFNSSCAISISSGAKDLSRLVGIEIYNLQGKCVGAGSQPALNESRAGLEPAPTNGTCIWTPDKELGSGIYFVRAKIGEQTITKRVVYLK